MARRVRCRNPFTPHTAGAAGNCVCFRVFVRNKHLVGDPASPFHRTISTCLLSRILLNKCPPEHKEHAEDLLIDAIRAMEDEGAFTPAMLPTRAVFESIAQQYGVENPVMPARLAAVIPLDGCSGNMTSFIGMAHVGIAMKMLRGVPIDNVAENQPYVRGTRTQAQNVTLRAWRNRAGPTVLPTNFPEAHRPFAQLLLNQEGGARGAHTVERSIASLQRRLERLQAFGDPNFFINNDNELQQIWNERILQYDPNLHPDRVQQDYPNLVPRSGEHGNYCFEDFQRQGLWTVHASLRRMDTQYRQVPGFPHPTVAPAEWALNRPRNHDDWQWGNSFVWGGNVWPRIAHHMTEHHNWNGTDPVDLAFFHPDDAIFTQHVLNNGLLPLNCEFFGVGRDHYFCVPRVSGRVTRMGDTYALNRLTFN